MSGCNNGAVNWKQVKAADSAKSANASVEI